MIYLNYKDGCLKIQTSDWDGIERRQYITHEVVTTPYRIKTLMNELQEAYDQMSDFYDEKLKKELSEDLQEIKNLETKIRLLKLKHKIDC